MDRHPDFRYDLMTDRRSYGSSYRPCSQPRKISIGVVVDSSAKKTTTAASDRVNVEVRSTKKVNSSNANPLENAHKQKGDSPHSLQNQIKAPCQIASPWVSTRSFHQKVSSSEAIIHTKQESHLLFNGNVHKPSTNGTQEAVKTHSVSVFGNQASVLQSSSVHRKKFVSVGNQWMSGDNGTVGKMEDPLHTPANNGLLKEQVTEGTSVAGNSGNDTLRKKLWEILENVSTQNKQQSNSQTGEAGASTPKPSSKSNISSPNKQQPTSQTGEAGANNPKPSSNSGKKASSMIKRRQQSDTIETDSDSPVHSIKRPVTRSLSRKKPRTKASPQNTEMAPLYREKQTPPEDNIFSFDEGWSKRLNFSTPKSKREESKRKISRVDPYNMCLFGKNIANKAPRATNKTPRAAGRGKKKNPANSSVLGYNTGKLSDPTRKNSEPVEAANDLKEFHKSPAKEVTGQPGNISGPILERHVVQHDEYSNRSPKNIVKPKYGLKSPAFELKTPFQNSSPCSSSKTDQGESDDGSPAVRAFNMDQINSSKTSLSSKGLGNKAYKNMESFNCVRELEDSPVVDLAPDTNKQDEENGLSKSPCEEGDLESSEDDSPITSLKEAGSLSPVIETAEKPVLGLSLAKGNRKQGNEVNKWLHGLSEQYGEDELASAVILFASALERIKHKTKSAISRRAAEILTSASEKAKLILQNAESQIHGDVGKLISVNKSKRNIPETVVQEQQEHLKLLFKRFNDEVNQYLLNCKSGFEGLEAHELEIKGTIEKQRVSQKKILLQAQESIETELEGAERRIASMQKLAREKMIKLKRAIAESL